jgi:hypothetical protein
MPKASLDYATVSAELASITFNFLCATKYANNLYGPGVNYNGNERTVVFFWGGGWGEAGVVADIIPCQVMLPLVVPKSHWKLDCIKFE